MPSPEDDQIDEIIKEVRSSKCLHLKHNIQPAAINTLMERLHNSNEMRNVTSIIIEQPSDLPFSVIRDFISSTTGLAKLVLRGQNKIRPEEMRELLLLLLAESTQLSSLSLQNFNNAMTSVLSENMDKISELAKRFLRNLDLSNSAFNPFDVEELGKAIDQPTKLESLNLSNTRLGDVGARAIANRISKSERSLTSLDLSGNQITNDGASSIAKALERKTTTLQTLSLESNGIQSEGVESCLAALKENKHLSRLNISNNLSDNTVGVERAYKRNLFPANNHSLISLVYDSDTCNREVKEGIENRLKQNNDRLVLEANIAMQIAAERANRKLGSSIGSLMKDILKLSDIKSNETLQRKVESKFTTTRFFKAETKKSTNPTKTSTNPTDRPTKSRKKRPRENL